MSLRDHFELTSDALKRWFVAQCYDVIIVGLLWLAALWYLHVPLAPLWAVLGGLLQFVPNFGPVLALLAPTLALLISRAGWQRFVGLLIAYAVIAILDGLLLAALPDAPSEPRPYVGIRFSRPSSWGSSFRSGECFWLRRCWLFSTHICAAGSRSPRRRVRAKPLSFHRSGLSRSIANGHRSRHSRARPETPEQRPSRAPEWRVVLKVPTGALRPARVGVPSEARLAGMTEADVGSAQVSA